MHIKQFKTKMEAWIESKDEEQEGLEGEQDKYEK